jgi:hypothetical protein
LASDVNYACPFLNALMVELVDTRDLRKLSAWARNPYVESSKFGGNPLLNKRMYKRLKTRFFEKCVLGYI